MTPEEIFLKYYTLSYRAGEAILTEPDALKAMVEYAEEKDKEIAALKTEIEKLKEDIRLLNLPIVNFVKRQIKKQDDQIIP